MADRPGTLAEAQDLRELVAEIIGFLEQMGYLPSADNDRLGEWRERAGLGECVMADRPGTYETTPVHCEQCGSLEFRVMYDAKVGGYHAECAKCGGVFLGLR